MMSDRNDEWLDESLDKKIRQAVGRQGSPFDAAAWMRKHPEEVRILKSRKTAAPADRRWRTWRTIMHARYTKVAASAAVAAAIIVAAIIWSFGDGASIAYALDQTVRASRQLKNYHIRITPAAGGIGELWAQMDEQGHLVRIEGRIPRPSKRSQDHFLVQRQGQSLVQGQEDSAYCQRAEHPEAFQGPSRDGRPQAGL